jgi:hypothetical protein
LEDLNNFISLSMQCMLSEMRLELIHRTRKRILLKLLSSLKQWQLISKAKISFTLKKLKKVS